MFAMDKLAPSVIVCLVVGFASCQYDQGRGGYQHGSQPPANILLHKQALGQDGSFNYAFAADNGLRQGEVINPDGSRKGSYSYVDPNGKTVTLSYTAGKDGFKVLSGDHVPKSPEGQQQGQNLQYYRPPPPNHHHHPHGPSPRDPPRYPLFRPDPVPYEAYRNAPDAPVYRGNPAPHGEAYGQIPRHPPPPPYGEPLLHEGPRGAPPRLPHHGAPYHQPRQYSVQEGDHERPSPYLNHRLQGEYRQEGPGKPHSFGNGYSFEFAG